MRYIEWRAERNFYDIFGKTGYNGRVPISTRETKKRVFSDTVGPLSIFGSVRM